MFNNRNFDEIIRENVEALFTDADEIGSSDVSICCNYILKDMGLDRDSVEPGDYSFLRGQVQFAIRDLLG